MSTTHPRVSVCSFSFADGRRCRMPRRNGHPYLCVFHARKEAQALAAERVGEDIARCLSGDYVSACDLSAALGRLFAAVAQGHIKPKTAVRLAYLGQTIVQALHLAQHEYINAFGTESWRRTVRSSFAPPEPPAPPPPAPSVPLSPSPSPKPTPPPNQAAPPSQPTPPEATPANPTPSHPSSPTRPQPNPSSPPVPRTPLESTLTEL